MDKNYQKAVNYLNKREIEKALTTFIRGIDRGEAKCAFGVLKIVTDIGTPTFLEQEAVDIFTARYFDILAMAEDGDDEAMVMVAEAIRCGFVDDDEPYFMWLYRARSLGNADAAAILAEVESAYALDYIGLDDGEFGEQALILGERGLVGTEDSEGFPSDGGETVLLADADDLLLDDLGVYDAW